MDKSEFVYVTYIRTTPEKASMIILYITLSGHSATSVARISSQHGLRAIAMREAVRRYPMCRLALLACRDWPVDSSDTRFWRSAIHADRRTPTAIAEQGHLRRV
jgi:hypothetical protein